MIAPLRVGILTHHNIKNYGAYLQAYALLRTVESLGHEVTVVNFINFPHVCRNYRPFFIRKPNLKKHLNDDIRDYLLSWGQFMKFSRVLKHLNLTHPVFNASHINALGLDALVVGSDEVWNFIDVGFHPVKFGIGIDVPILISYAAGTGSVMPDDTPPMGVAEGLMKFNRFSVRERGGAEWIKNLLGITPRIVLDPTLIYDFEMEELPCPILDGEYLLVYQCELKQESQEAVRMYAEENHLRIVGAGCSDTWFDKGLINIDPFTWLSLFKNARLVVTGTFHGTVFALKYRRDFVAWPTSINRTNKIESYLSEVGLQDRMNCCTVHEFCALLDTPVDYEAFDRKLLLQREDSVDYLKQCLNKTQC